MNQTKGRAERFLLCTETLATPDNNESQNIAFQMGFVYERIAH